VKIILGYCLAALFVMAHPVVDEDKDAECWALFGNSVHCPDNTRLVIWWDPVLEGCRTLCEEQV